MKLIRFFIVYYLFNINMVKFAKKTKKYKKTTNKITNNLNKKNNIIKSKYKKRIKTKLTKIKFVNPLLFDKNSYIFLSNN